MLPQQAVLHTATFTYCCSRPLFLYCCYSHLLLLLPICHSCTPIQSSATLAFSFSPSPSHTLTHSCYHLCLLSYPGLALYLLYLYPIFFTHQSLLYILPPTLPSHCYPIRPLIYFFPHISLFPHTSLSTHCSPSHTFFPFHSSTSHPHIVPPSTNPPPTPASRFPLPLIS